MTKQIRDQLIYEGQRYLPLSFSGKGLPHPRDFGIEPSMFSTACYRGFYREFTIHDGHLWLTHLVVHQSKRDYPPIDGVYALYDEERFLNDDEDKPEFLLGRSVAQTWGNDPSKNGRFVVTYDGGIYSGLNIFAPLTGGILLGFDEVDVPIVHLILHYLIRSKTVLELLFDNGKLINVIDHSVAVNAKRTEVLNVQRPDFNSPEYKMFETSIETWIQSTLKHDYIFLEM